MFIACIQNAWHILPFEMLQGITHAAVWATLCSLLEDAASEESSEETQAWLHAAYSAMGKGLGSILGGFLIRWLGTRSVFGMYALASLLVLLILFLILIQHPDLDAVNPIPPNLTTTSTVTASAASANSVPMPEMSSWDNASVSMSNNNYSISNQTSLTAPAGPSFCGLTPHGVPTAPIGSILTEPPLTPPAPAVMSDQQNLFAQNDPLADQLISGTLRDWKPEVRTYRQTLQKQFD